MPWEESGGCLYSWPGGVRRRGGASSVQALVWNLGTARLDVFGRVLQAVGVRENSKRLKP